MKLAKKKKKRPKETARCVLTENVYYYDFLIEIKEKKKKKKRRQMNLNRHQTQICRRVSERG